MKSDQVTIITPCLNPGPYLEECLDSVQRQGSIISAHIVIDGGSTDGTVELLEETAKRDPKLIWRSQQSTGQAAALNEALALVDTEYFGWLNADDRYEDNGIPHLLERALKEVQRPPSIIYGDYRVIDDSGRTLRMRRQPTFDYTDCLYSYLTVLNAAALFRTTSTRSIGGLNSGLQFCMDYDLVLRLSKDGRVIHVKQYVASFRLHDNSKTATLMNLCREETHSLRIEHSGKQRWEIALRGVFGRIRVAARMAREGCLACRLGFG